MHITFVRIIILLLALIVHYFVAVEFYKVAIMKGWSQRKYFFMAFLLWLVGYMLIIALPDRGGSSRKVVVSDDLPDL